jgi:hypothetical protein
MLLDRAFVLATLLAAGPFAPAPVPAGAPAPDAASDAGPDGAPAPLPPAESTPTVLSPADHTPLDLTPEVRTLARVAACAPDGTVPERFDRQIVESHCKILASLRAQWTARWLVKARRFFDQVVPDDLPPRLVYPFGGGDLLTALVAFPTASEITTLSLESAGDPRAIDTLVPGELAATLSEVRQKVSHLLSVGHSKTIDMRTTGRNKFPGDLMYSLVALTLHDLEVVSVRFFRVGPDGETRYVTAADVDSTKTDGARSLFSDMEIVFQARNQGGGRRVFRHIAVNLDDTHLEADPSVLRHLEAKGRVVAMTKAASYLLWWKEFGKIRDYLLHHMVWMVSDSTGIPPDEARAAGFEQIPFGRFDGPFLGGGNRPTEAFRKLWADDPGPLAFRFGYPDRAGQNHLLITRPIAEK